MSAFIDSDRARFGVEPICRALDVSASTYYACKARERAPSQRARRDQELLGRIRAVHERNFSVYGARKVYWQLGREGVEIAKCTTERLMRLAGLEGARRGKRKRTTIPAEGGERAPDLVQRNFKASAPNRLWVSDFTYVMTWSGVCYVAFAIDVFSRRIVGWKADRSMHTALVLDTLEMALWSRDHHGLPVGEDLVHHSDAGSQYTAFAFTARLVDAGVDASVGSVGDAYDNALCETTIGLYKTELIERRGPWKTIEEVELATLEWVDWFNHRRLHGALGKMAPAEYERSFLEGTLPAGGQEDGSPAPTSPRASDRLTIARTSAERREMAAEGSESLPASLPTAGDGAADEQHADGALALGCEAPESFETTQTTQTKRSP